MAKDKNFKKEVFERKVKAGMAMGHTREGAEWQVLMGYNTDLKGGKWTKSSNPVDKDGNYINKK